MSHGNGSVSNKFECLRNRRWNHPDIHMNPYTPDAFTCTHTYTHLKLNNYTTVGRILMQRSLTTKGFQGTCRLASYMTHYFLNWRTLILVNKNKKHFGTWEIINVTEMHPKLHMILMVIKCIYIWKIKLSSRKRTF